MGTSTTPDNGNAVQLINANTLKVYNVGTGEWVNATTGLAYAAVWNYPTGGARIVFIPASEEIIGAAATKTYELRGDILYGGAAGDSFSVKIEDLSATSTVETMTQTYYHTSLGSTVGEDDSTATSSEVYYSISSFVWTDRSKAGGATHSYTSADWTNDYKVSGIPTATLTLSK